MVRSVVLYVVLCEAAWRPWHPRVDWAGRRYEVFCRILYAITLAKLSGGPLTGRAGQATGQGDNMKHFVNHYMPLR